MGYTFGVDYYPEHWPRERWQTDARMMREMGITIVRMAEFSWAKWEPREGEFHFEELDEVIALMANEGIDCILGTPSAAPPAWIIEETPEIQPLDSHLQRHYFGGRHHDCQSNAQYRAHIRRFVTAYARHFAANPHVVGWQVDNELGNSHEDLCYCPSCEASFRQWLQKKYGSIDCLNESWGTAFWSQTYTDFEQIHAPRITAAGKNPSQQLDWMRFCSDLVLDFHQMQADILRSETPDKFITHNMMGFSRKVDYFKLGDQLDFTAQDQYPGGHFVPQGVFRGDIQAAELDFIRSLKHRPFWVMEQQSAITGWETVGRTPKPGQLGLWAMQSIAHGADTIVFFRWRSCVMGTEQYWHGILPHNGRPGRYYRELKAFMQEAGPLLERLQGSVPHPEVAMLFSYDQYDALSIQPHHPHLQYSEHLLTYYSGFYRQKIPVEFVREEDDWSSYRVLVAPLQFLMTEKLSEKFHAYVQQGGVLILDMRSGVKDATNLAFAEKELPAMLDDLCGVRVAEYDCLLDTQGIVRWGNDVYPCEKWCDILEVADAEILATYDSEFYAGTPAVSKKQVGKGTVYYVGTEMSSALADRFVQQLAEQSSLHRLPKTPEGVEATVREKDGIQYLFLLNHTGTEQHLCVPDTWEQLGAASAEQCPPYGYCVYRVQADDQPV